MPEKIAVILAKDRHPSIQQQALHDRLLAGLEHRAGLDVTVVPHLYDLAPDGPVVRFLRSIRADMIVLAWLYPRSTYWVLEASGIQGRLGRTSSLGEEEPLESPQRKPSRHERQDRTFWCFDLRRHDEPEPYLRQIAEIVARYTGLAERAEELAGKPNGKARVLEETTRLRWYPVVDRDRCTDCKECLNFCLFGVYGLDDRGGLLVENPDACRPGCPACARICPSGAILFPQHQDPAIAGDPQAPLQGLKLDLSQIFSGADPAALAAEERARALADREGDQPDSPPGPTDSPPNKTDVDRLIDKLDSLEF
jgi:hypothetical protein